jgi:hypothetical protein
MKINKFEILKVKVQEIIDTIASKNLKAANNKLQEVSAELDELLDLTNNEIDLMEISRYQVLLNQLQRKITSKQ